MAPVHSKQSPNAPSGQDNSAIVGLACRVPGASSPSKLWDLMEEQRDLQKKMPAERFNVDAFYHPDGANKGTMNAKYGYFLDQDISQFDAGFFNISGKEAEAMDPQQRLLLEVVYEALEDAGITLQEINGSQTSVFCGCFTNDYNAMSTKDLEYYPKYLVTGTGNSILANRISYFYNLHGASATIDTACSSSLVCFHMGNQSLKTHESDLSIIIGSALHFDPNIFITMTDLGMLSTDGRCRAFDAAGRGYVRGEGICAAVIKRSSDARTDGNHIRAIVRGTNVNHDGTKQGITMPNPAAHELLIRRAYKDAGLDPLDTQYFEAHGTGTAAGDPRETRAIGAVFAPNRTQPLIVGSVKTNIGHLEGASGLAALIKTTMSLEQGKIPANMHFNNPNPSIAFEDWKIQVPTKTMDWPACTGPKRASVNSFGYGGTNAHIILEAYEPSESDEGFEIITERSLSDRVDGRPTLVPLTSHSKKAGSLLIKDFLNYLEMHPDTSIEDFAHTLSTKRTMHKFRSFAIGTNLAETIENLKNPKPTAVWTPTLDADTKPRIGFVFTGQGGQWFAMGRQLIEQSAFFRQTLERCDEVLGQLPDSPDWSVVEELLKTKETSRLGDTRFSQPICTALQLALVDLLAEWGIEPSAAVGHSSGEMAAAYAAGIFSFEATIVTAYYRGVYMSNASTDASTIPGAMMAVGMTEPEAIAELKPFEGRLSIAAVNGPSSITLSGDKDAIVELKQTLVDRKVFARELQVTQAFHSHHMLPLAPGYKRALEKHENLITRPALRRMVSSVTARVADSEAMGPDYWTANMVGTVKFSDALTGILLDDYDEKNVDVLVEIGPHPALKGPARQVMSSLKVEVPYLASLTRGENDHVCLLTLAGQLFQLGYPVDLIAANSDIFKSTDGKVSKINSGMRLRNIPSYSWDHAKYWSETRYIKEHRQRKDRHTLLGARVPGSIQTHPRWRNYLRKAEIPWLSDHQIEGKVIFPAAGYITIAVEALVRLETDTGNIKQILIRDVMIKAALALTDKDMGTELLLELRPLPVSAKATSGTWHEFVLFSYDDNERCVENCRGLIALEKGSPAPVERTEPYQSSEQLQKATNRSIPVQKYYEHLWSLGLQYGHSFKLLQGDIETGPGFAIAPLSFLNKDHLAEQADSCVLHPTLLDASFHTLFGAIEASLGRSLDGVFVPTFCRSLKISGSFVGAESGIAEQNFYVCSDAGLPSTRVAVANLRIHSQTSNQLLVDMQGLECTALGDNSSAVGPGRSLFFKIRWQPAFDFLGDSANSLPFEDISGLMDTFAHQHPDSKILHLTSKPESTRKLLHHLGGRQHERRRFGKLAVFSFLDFMPERFEAIDREWSGLIEFGRPAGEDYDLIVVGEDLETDVKAFLKPNGFVIRDDANFEAAGMASIFDSSKMSAWRKNQSSVLPQGPLGLVLPSTASKQTQAVASFIDGAFGGKVFRTSFDEVAKGQVSLTENLIVLASLDEDIFFDTTSDHSTTFEVVKKMLTDGKKNIVWALQGATMNCPNPEQAIIVGLARTARSENEQLRLVTLDIDQTFDNERLAGRILQLLDSQIEEDELTERDGVLFIPRIEADDTLNSKLHNGVGHEARLEPFNQSRSLALEIQKVGLMDTLAFRGDQDVVDAELAADEVEVEVHASAISSRDIAVCLGGLVASTLGDECAGVIIRKGKSIGDDTFRLGDRVMVWKPGHGAHRKIVRNPASLCHRLGDISFEVAAALPIALTTACYALREVARLQRGETILIHSAGNGIGQIAVQLAQHIGANIIATAGSQDERWFLRDTLSVKDEQIFSNRDQSFVQGVMSLTNNKGADVVLNNLTGEFLHATWRCVAPFGRFVETGLRDITDNTRIDMEPFQKNITFASINLVQMYDHQRPLAARLLKECCQLIYDGTIKPVQPILAFPYAEASEAFSVAQSSEPPNKVVLQRGKDDMVPVLPPTYQNLPLFNPKKVYLLVGGLGGLGRTLAEWMVRRGAKRLAFLSRSGAQRPEAISTLGWLKARQVQTSVYCGDISGYATVRSCVQSIGSDLAGIFQAAMVLQDTPFERMSYELWQTSLRPKVAGTLNLHLSTLKSKLDFFICFSSCSAMVGAKAQANYSAANCFLDALMRNRRHMNLPGTTMDVGMIVGVGAVSETAGLQATMERIGYDPVNEEELLYQIEEAVTAEPRSCTNSRGVDMHQVITGISLARKDLYWAHKPLFRNLYANHDFNGSSESSVGHRDLQASLRSAVYPTECTSILTAAFVDKVSAVSGVDVDQIHPSNPLSAYGLDSLVAVELRKWFAKAVGVDVALFDILGSKTINALLSKAVVLFGNTREAEAIDTGAGAIEEADSRGDDVNASSRSLSEEVARIIKPANLPMSSFQTRIWFSHNFVADRSFLNIPIISRITGKPSLEILRQALQEMKKRNEILRTAYCEGEDYPEQIVLEDMTVELGFLDFSSQPQPNDALDAHISQMKKMELDIEEGEVMRASLVKLADSEFALVTIFHHISIDRGSSRAYLDQFVPIYDAISSGQGLQSIRSPALSYSDFAVWHNDRLLSSSLEPHIRFWKQKFKGAPKAGPLLPFAQSERPRQNDYKRAIHRAKLGLPILNRMKRICTTTGTTPFQFLLAAFRSFHYRYTEEKDLTILMIDGNRPHPDLEDMLGFFINMIPIRCSNDCDTSFDRLLTAVKDDVLEAMAHSEVPFDTIVDSIGNEKDSSCFPLGQVVINYQIHGKIPKYSTKDFDIHDITTEDMPTACEMNLEALEDDKGLAFRLEYSSTLYGEEDMARFMDNFATFITSTVKDYRQSVSEIEMCGPKELEVLRTNFWNTGFTKNHWDDSSVLHKIFSMADASPNSTAITTSEGEVISYQNLLSNAQKIGYALQEAGVVPGQYIGVLSRPGIEAIAAMLGILLSRCGFVPLDPDFAVERLAFMATDSDTAIILAGKGLEDVSAEVSYKGANSPRIMEISKLTSGEKIIALETVSPRDPFFTVYTSGSTGKPKGVLLSQSNTQQMLSTLQRDYDFGSEDRFLFSNSICFDLSIVQIFSALTAGATVCVACAGIRKDPVQLARFMQQVGITFTYFTPTQFALLLDRASDLLRNCSRYRIAFFAGERLPVRMAKAFYDLNTSATAYNTWSPSELVVQTTIHKVDYPDAKCVSIPIGFPLANCRHYIVDSRRQPLPAGLVGEICVGGAQVGTGYLNRPQANAKSFLEDPYCSPEDRARNWTRMFRTGDKGRFRPDGQLEFYGRIAGDKQIKLRGFRIDLGEVENEIHLKAASEDGPKLVDLSVVARATNNESPDFTDDRQLIAFLVPQQSLNLVQKREFVTRLHKNLKQQLNSYMLPNGYQFLNNLPVTIGGKVDRQNLLHRELDLVYPAMGSTAGSDSKNSSLVRDADANTLKAIIQLFKEVLKLPQSREVEASDNFFELGGQSIVVLRLQAKLKRAFKTTVPLSELFKSPTPMGVFHALSNKLQEVGLEGAKIEDSKVRWADEIKLPNESRYMVKNGTWKQSGSDISDILLVGVDSFAGLHMLASFLSANASMIVHVLGTTSPAHEADVLERFRQYHLFNDILTEETLSARTRYVPGSLAVPHFGLKQSEFRRLGETIQAIFHAGTQVSLLQTYSELKRVNVEAVLDIIELAGYGSRLTQINYLSTFSVPHLQTWNSSKRTHDKIIVDEKSASHFSPEETQEQGYFKSRWVAEMLLGQAADRGFAVSIFRASAISASTATKVSEPADDFLRRMVLTMIETGSVPEFGTPSTEFVIDFIPVNYLASAIYHLSTYAQGKREGPAIYHITNPSPLSLKGLPPIISDVRHDRKGGKMVHWDTWLNLIPTRDEKEQLRWNVIRDYFLKGHNMFALGSSKTLEALAAVGGADVECPPIDAHYFRSMYQTEESDHSSNGNGKFWAANGHAE